MARVDDLQSVSAEAGIIATLLMTPTYVYASDGLLPSDFYDSDNRCLYWAVQKLMDKGCETVDAFMISNILQSEDANRESVKNIPVESIKELFEFSGNIARNTVADYKVLVKEVLELSLRRQLYTQTQKMTAMCLDVNTSGESLPIQFFRLMDEVLKRSAVISDVQTVGEKFDDIMSRIARRKSGEWLSLPFKFPKLNEYVKVEQGELTLFSAYAKAGKSAMLLTLAIDLCVQNKSVLIIDSELSDELWFMRLVSHIAKIPFKSLRDATCSDEELARIPKVKDWLVRHRLYHIYMPTFDSSEILLLTKRINAIAKLDVIVVDYLKNTSSGTAYEVSNEMGRLTDIIKNQICGEMGIAGLGAVQSDKEGNVALSRNIERNCSTLISLTRKTKEEILRDGERCGNMKMQVRFNRNGQPHADDEYIDLRFIGDNLNFEQAEQHKVELPY